MAASTAFAGEVAVLASGARLRVNRHEADGAKVRLYHASGVVEMDAAQIKSIEVEEEEDEKEVEGLAPAPSSSPAHPPVTYAPVEIRGLLNPMELADAAADKYGLPRSLVRSVMATESNFQTYAVSPKGAIGLMQLMPETAAELGANPYDPKQNVDAGVRYLRDLLEKYKGALWHALAAYNAGPGAVDRYNGIPPYRETIQYIRSIQRRMRDM